MKTKNSSLVTIVFLVLFSPNLILSASTSTSAKVVINGSIEEYSNLLNSETENPVVHFKKTESVTIVTDDYCKFLNNVAAVDSHNLYKENQTEGTSVATPCILRSGTPGYYTYVVATGDEERLMFDVDPISAMRYCNWLQNGFGSINEDLAITEHGSYTLQNDQLVAINPEATYFIAGEGKFTPSSCVVSSGAEFKKTSWKTVGGEEAKASEQVCGGETRAPNRVESKEATPAFHANINASTPQLMMNPSSIVEEGKEILEKTLGRGNSPGYRMIDSAGYFDTTGGSLIQSTPNEEEARVTMDETEDYATTAKIKKDETSIRQEIACKEEYLKKVVAQRDQAKTQANSLPKDSPQQIDAKNLWKKLSKDVKKARDSHRYAQNALNSILANDQSDDESRTTNESDDTTATLSDEEDRTFLVVLKKGVKRSVKQEMLNTYEPYLQEVRHPTALVGQHRNDSSEIIRGNSVIKAIQKFAEETKVEQEANEGSILKQSISSLKSDSVELSISQRADEALKRSQIALTKALEAEHEENQEIANMWYVASENLQLVAKHWNNANIDYAIAVEEEVSDLEKYIASFIAADKEDKELCSKPDNEFNSLQKKILKIIKTSSKYPYIRIEEEVDDACNIVKQTKMVADHLLIRLKAGETKESFEEKLACPEAILEEDPLLAPFYLLRFLPENFQEDKESASRLLDSMTTIVKKIETGGFAVCTPDFLMHGVSDTLTSSDTKLVNQSNKAILNQGITNPIILAVLDTGIFRTHSELYNNIWNAPTKYGRKSYGYNAIHEANPLLRDDPKDDHGHGTHVAGIAVTNFTDYCKYINDSCPSQMKIMACKWLNKNNTGSLEDAIKCINYACHGQNDLLNNDSLNNNASIVNFSAGGEGLSCMTIEGLRAAMCYSSQDTVFVVAAGNNGKNLNEVDVFPAKLGIDLFPATLENNIIVVAATDSITGGLINGSNFGDKVDVAAPEHKIYSTWNCVEGHNICTGTSMATPAVASSLVAMKAKFADNSVLALRTKLLTASEQNGNDLKLSLSDNNSVRKVKYGRLNIHQLLKSDGEFSSEEDQLKMNGESELHETENAKESSTSSSVSISSAS